MVVTLIIFKFSAMQGMVAHGENRMGYDKNVPSKSKATKTRWFVLLSCCLICK